MYQMTCFQVRAEMLETRKIVSTLNFIVRERRWQHSCHQPSQIRKSDQSFNTRGCESAKSSTVPPAQAADNQNRLVILMNFNNRANGLRMRVSKVSNKTKKDMKVLKENYDKLQRKCRSMICSMQRMKQKSVRDLVLLDQ